MKLRDQCAFRSGTELMMAHVAFNVRQSERREIDRLYRISRLAHEHDQVFRDSLTTEGKQVLDSLRADRDDNARLAKIRELQEERAFRERLARRKTRY